VQFNLHRLILKHCHRHRHKRYYYTEGDDNNYVVYTGKRKVHVWTHCH